MPKVIDNYVLEQKIGSGQFGDVFRGYNKDTRADIAAKVIRRDTVKGKFGQLFENEVRVLKSCSSPNIIKLYDLKKTNTNFYLIMEYCNEGDLAVYLKRTQTLSEREAVGFFLQIINGFRTLVANKVLHRDFKLANLLKHNGQIKIADFGFSKLLGGEEYTSTVLGSPLHMAPEVIGGNDYNNKADVWSVGTVFYEMLYGRPPYNASNMAALIANIKNKPLEFPRCINVISECTEQLIRRMLIPNPNERISWEELFVHPIHHLFEQPNRLCQQKKSENNSTNESQPETQQTILTDPPALERKLTTKTERQDSSQEDKSEQTPSPTKQQILSPLKKSTEEQPTQPKQRKVRSLQESCKRNGSLLLHYRNVYVFLAAVSEDAMNNSEIAHAQVVGYLIVKKLLTLIDWLSQIFDGKLEPPAAAEHWEQFIKERDFKDIRQYVAKEHEMFKTFHMNIFRKLLSKAQRCPPEARGIFKNIEEDTDSLLGKMLREYIRLSIRSLLEVKNKSTESLRKSWLHVDRCFDCLNLEESFRFEQPDGELFNFRRYYDSGKLSSLEELIKRVQTRASGL